MTEKIRNQKDSLARLMATENLTVVHKKIPTAYFDVKNRVLACPTFKEDMSPELYDLFMGHEVGHALNTPFEGLHSTIKENRTLKGYLNVVEDVRIEKAIKNKYAGLRKSFYKAYNELMDRDFFGIKGRDLQTLSLIDKINLITKCGSRVSITLTDEEQKFLDMAEDCKTWEDVVVCAEAIYEWSKENETRDENDQAVSMPLPEDDEEEFEDDSEEFESDYSPSDDAEDEDQDEEEDADASNDEESEEESDAKEEIMVTGKKGGKFEGKYDDLEGARESITEHFAHNNEDQFVDENACVKSTINLKEKFKNKDIDAVLYPYKRVLSDWRNFYEGKDKDSDDEHHDFRMKKRLFKKELAVVYRKHVQQKNKKIVAHMAKEFDMSQTAQRSAKAFTGTSGDLDMNRLAKYQIVDDIFKRVTYLPDGKNHGVNVMVDWSGSISQEVKDLLEQAIILAEFCNKVQIPFRVYLFSDSIERADRYDYSSGSEKLVEVLSNEMKSKEYIEMLDYLSAIMLSKVHSDLRGSWNGGKKQRVLADSYNKILGDINYFDVESDNYWDDRWCDWDMVPDNYGLGGTPLDATLVAMRKFLPEFNKRYNVEKSILTVITDGFSHGADVLRQDDAEREDIKSQIGDEWRYNSQRYILDPYTNKTFIFEDKSGGNGYYYRNDFEQTQNLLEWLSATCNVTVTGYFVFSTKRDFSGSSEIILKGSGRESWEDRDKIWLEMKKTGCVVKVKGYNKLFLTSSSALGVEGDDELDDEFIGANKNRVMAAFKRNQKGKSTSRFLTNEFIKEIA